MIAPERENTAIKAEGIPVFGSSSTTLADGCPPLVVLPRVEGEPERVGVGVIFSDGSI